MFTSLLSLFYINLAFYTETELKFCISCCFQMQPSQEYLKHKLRKAKRVYRGEFRNREYNKPEKL